MTVTKRIKILSAIIDEIEDQGGNITNIGIGDDIEVNFRMVIGTTTYYQYFKDAPTKAVKESITLSFKLVIPMLEWEGDEYGHLSLSPFVEVTPIISEYIFRLVEKLEEYTPNGVYIFV